NEVVAPVPGGRPLEVAGKAGPDAVGDRGDGDLVVVDVGVHARPAAGQRAAAVGPDDVERVGGRGGHVVVAHVHGVDEAVASELGQRRHVTDRLAWRKGYD